MGVRLDDAVLRRLIDRNPDKVNELLRSAAQDITNDIKLLMTDSTPSGREYLRGTKVHVASAPGEPPAPDTGALRASIDWYQETPTRMIVHDGVEYGVYLELGSERVAPRPFVNPIFDTWKRYKLIDLARDIWSDV